MWHCTVYLATYYIVAWNKVLLCITLTLWIFSSGLKRSLIGGFSEGVQEIVYDPFFFFFFLAEHAIYDKTIYNTL